MRRFILFAGDRNTTPNDFPRKRALKMHDSETDNEFSIQPVVGPRFVLFTSLAQEQKASNVLHTEILERKMNITKRICHSQYPDKKQGQNRKEKDFHKHIRILV